jgi:hypothetical protein
VKPGGTIFSRRAAFGKYRISFKGESRAMLSLFVFYLGNIYISFKEVAIMVKNYLIIFQRLIDTIFFYKIVV